MMSRESSTIPVVFCIDVEPDKRQTGRESPAPWHGYEGTQRYLSELRSRIEKITGSPAHYSWFFRMDPQIAAAYGSASWAIDRYRRFVDDIQRHGDELGVHLHPFRWVEADKVWIQDFADQPWVDHCASTSLEAFARAVGRRCVAFRFGSFWLSTETVNLIERMGVRFELTVEPGRLPLRDSSLPEAPGRGGLPDFRRAPRVPYTPSESDFCRPLRTGTRGIRMIPLTSGALRLGFRPRAYLRRLLTHGARYRKQNMPLSMWRRWKAPNTFSRMLDGALAAQARPYLAFAIQVDTGIRPEIFEAVDHALTSLLAHPARSRFVFSTPVEALQTLGIG
jgi:hypothetical protein